MFQKIVYILEIGKDGRLEGWKEVTGVCLPFFHPSILPKGQSVNKFFEEI